MKTFKSFIKESTHMSSEKPEDKDPPMTNGQWIADTSENHHILDKDYPFNDKSTYDIKNDISRRLRQSHKIDDEHVLHISNYTGSYSRPVNDKLIQNNGHIPVEESDKFNKEYRDITKHIDIATKKYPIQHDLHVYSGVTFDPREHINSDGLMHSPAHISTTHDRHTAYDYSLNNGEETSPKPAHIIHFHLKKGDPAVHISGISRHRLEHETVLAKNLVLKHHGTTEHKFQYKEYPLVVHHMTIHGYHPDHESSSTSNG